MFRFPKRRPDAFTVFIATASLLLGAVALSTGAISSPTVHTLLPEWMPMWNMCLTFGGTVGLGSLATRDWTISAALERLSSGFLAALFGVYGVAICVVDDAFFAPASGVMFAATIAAAIRAYSVHQEIRQTRRKLRDLAQLRRGDGDVD